MAPRNPARRSLFATSTSGRTARVGKARDLGLDPSGGRWVAICEGHGSIVNVGTRGDAVICAEDPTNFCDDCRDGVPMKSTDDEARRENPVLPAIRPPSDNVRDVMDATYESGGYIVGRETVPVASLVGGVRLDDPGERRRVDALAAKIAAPGGYVARLIVDTDGNVLEGQHRLEALRQLGIEDAPIVRVGDLTEGLPVDAMHAAVLRVGPLRSDSARQIVTEAARMLRSSGSAEAALREYDLPHPYERHFEAALRAGDRRVNPVVARHLGHCQICEREQKLHHGKLVHHGYRRPGHGEIEGDCYGVGHVPYETSCDLVKEYLLIEQQRLVTEQEFVRRLHADEVEVLHVLRHRTMVEHRRDTTEPMFWKRLVHDRTVEAEWRAKTIEREIVRLETRIATWIPRAVRTVEEAEQESRSVVDARKATRTASQEARRTKEAAKQAKQDDLKARRAAIVADLRTEIVALGALVPLPSWAVLDRLKRKIRSHTWLRADVLGVERGELTGRFPHMVRAPDVRHVDVQAAMVKLGMAEYNEHWNGGWGATNF